MNITLFGCTNNTLHATRYLSKLGLKIDLITISPMTAEANKVAGYTDLTLNKELFSSIYVSETYELKTKKDKDNFRKIEKLKLGFSCGWQRLIPSEILDCFVIGVFGMHGSSRNLPFGKGRSPMNWSLIEGRKWFHTNLFKYQSGIDDGPIVDRCTFSINLNDTAETLHYKNILAMCHLIKKNLKALMDGTIKEITPQQIEIGESFYPKRAPADGAIDWRDDIFNIERLIRAVTNPFYGAFSFFNGSELIIIRSSILYTDVEQHPFKDSSFGEVLDVFPNNKFLVRCSGGVLLVHEYKGDTPTVGLKFDEHEGTLNLFERNNYGFFDV